MADPFSIFTSALTVADVCVRVSAYLRSVHRTAKDLDNEITTLEHEIDAFHNVYTTLEKLCATSTAQQQRGSHQPAGLENPCDALWTRAAELVREGQHLVEKLRDLLLAVLGSESAPNFRKVDDLRKAIKLLSKDKDYTQLRRRLTDLNLELNTMLTAIDLTSNSIFRYNTYTSLEQLPGKLSQKLQELGLQLKAQIDSLEHADDDLEPSIVSAKAAVAYTSLNEHFYVQKPDTSIWTGRRRYLDQLRNALLSRRSAIERTQRRYVINGVPGAGKTQFCCKFAQDYRESFWGIFWVDASNPQNAAESWKKIAKIGGRDANEEAGKHWLSNLHSPWLLIIDSADNSEESLGAQFPSGERGCILITTRNPRLNINATVGTLSLDRLEESEANDLLRKATKHEPWDSSAKTSASSIARHLGYLPLALIHAGRAIFHRLCTLHGYIPFFNRTLDDMLSKRSSRTQVEQEDHGMGAFTSFDIIYSGLEAQAYRKTVQARISHDAIELINMFAFLHNNDIHLEILTKAGQNLEQISERGKSGDDAEESGDPLPSHSLLKRLKDWAFNVVVKLKLPAPVFPHVFRDTKTHSFNESRARRAIDLLVQMSLLTESSETGSYSMHPLVHVWVRKRLSTAAQALWCEAAGNVLASSIKLPPLVDEQGDQDFYLRILPHVNQVRGMKRGVEHELRQNREDVSRMRSWLWMSRPMTFTAIDAANYARYGRVYMESSQFEEAEKLLRLVQDFVTGRLGREHPIAVRIQLALAVNLWHLGRAPEAQQMQEDALQICRATLGARHSQTLKIMDGLGETYWQRGWLKEAKALHESAIKGMEGRSLLVRDMFKAMDHLGRVHTWYAEFDQARALHEKAFNGLSEAFGNDDFDAMVAADNLAMTLLLIGGAACTRRAYDTMQEVYDRRQRKLGKEHVYTLWAACNLARTMAARGSLESDADLVQDAKQMFREGLEVATRNLGPDHIGTLMGRTHLAHTLALEGRYDEAENDYRDIAERQKHITGARAGSHRDRLMTLQMLIKCYELQDRFEEGSQVCVTMITELDAMGGQKHPWRQQIVEKRERLLARVKGDSDARMDQSTFLR